MAFREAFCVIRTSSKFPSLKSAVRIRTCKEIPARRIFRRSIRVCAAATCGATTAFKCSGIGRDEPRYETLQRSHFLRPLSLRASELAIERGYPKRGTKGQAPYLEHTSFADVSFR